MDCDNVLLQKANEFLEARKYSNNLIDILESLENSEDIPEAIAALELIFTETLMRRTMLLSAEKDAQVSKYISWLQECYNNTWNALLNLVDNVNFGKQAVSVMFRLLAQEGKTPIIPQKKTYYFPLDKLEVFLKKYFCITENQLVIKKELDEFTNYLDVVYYFWLITPSVLHAINPTKEQQVLHVLDTLKQIPIPSPDELTDFDTNMLLCCTKNKTKFKPKHCALQQSVQELWKLIQRWNYNDEIYKKSLILLIENVLPNLDKPIFTLDYFMEALNYGNPVSLLALQGIFILVKDHNLEYPNIYGKLYTLFEPSIFCTKYKSRLFVLANIFLSSTHLPEMLVASFAKRISRLCLQAPPHDIVLMARFVGNLLIRHSGLKILIQRQTGGEVASDPFNDEEQDPLKTGALESSLWELESLQNHILPLVSSAVSFINRPLPTVEWDLTPLLENSYDEMFEKECKKKINKVSLTFIRPDSFFVPRTDYFHNLWSF